MHVFAEASVRCDAPLPCALVASFSTCCETQTGSPRPCWTESALSYPYFKSILRRFLSLQVLKINPEKRDIDGFAFEDFEIVGYQPHKKIAMELAV